MNSLVTIVIPTLNGADTIPATLLSVVAQDYPNLDILISDNGSSDDVLGLAKSLAQGDPRVRYRRNEKTVPIHEHYNQCVAAARGEFYVSLDDDDVVSANYISELVGVAERHPGMNAVLAKNVFIDEHGTVVKQFAVPDAEALDSHEVICDWLYGRTQFFGSISTFMARTSVVRHFGGYQNFARGQNIDNLLFLQCALGNRVGFASKAVFMYRTYAGSYGHPDLAQLARSTRAFGRHLARDPRTVEALAALPSDQRKEIIEGVRSMGIADIIYQSKLDRERLSLSKIRRLLSVPFEPFFYRVVCAYYVQRFRARASLFL